MTKPSITRREFICQTGMMGAGILSGGLASCSSNVHARPPNILFLLSDDQRWDTLSCMGNSVLKTPNIDSLAKKGVLFSNAFVTTSICPSNRASVLSGQHMRTHGVRDFADPFSPEAFDKTYPALLRAAGYRTGFIGKYGVGWHEEALPITHFDYWEGFPGQGTYFREIDGERVHSSQMMADQAIDFMRNSPKDQPWCLSISFKAPHMPWTEFDPKLESLLKDEEIPLASTGTSTAEESQPEFIRDSLVGSRGFWDLPENDIQEWVRNYYRLVKGVDIAVGKILNGMHALKFDGNTVVIFTSDNGMLLYEHGLMGKWLMYEESIRIPMIVYDPRVPPELRNLVRHEMVLSIDCAPTILATAGVPIPATMQGKDLTPLLQEGHVNWRQDWFYEHTYTIEYPSNIPKSQGVRTPRWKYIRYIDQDPDFEQLFDLSADPLETKNVAPDANHVDSLEYLRERLVYWRNFLPNVSPDPDEQAFDL